MKPKKSEVQPRRTMAAAAGKKVATKSASPPEPADIVRPRRLGRPRTRFEEPKVVPTRCPANMYTYMKMIAPLEWRSLTAMFQDMMTRFLDTQPWNHGLLWRKPRTALTFQEGVAGRTGWEQVNIQLPPDLAERVEIAAVTAGISKAAFCYTAMFWWIQYVYPPKAVGKLSQ